MLPLADHIRILLSIVGATIIIISIAQMPTRKQSLPTWIMYANNSDKTTHQNPSRYAYYVCTQVWNETDEHMIEWIEHQIFRLGFRNVCMISVEEPLNKTLVTRYHLATITKMSRAQEWKYCLECFTDPPMRPQDMLMIQVEKRKFESTDNSILKQTYRQKHYLSQRTMKEQFLMTGIIFD